MEEAETRVMASACFCPKRRMWARAYVRGGVGLMGPVSIALPYEARPSRERANWRARDDRSGSDLLDRP